VFARVTEKLGMVELRINLTTFGENLGVVVNWTRAPDDVVARLGFSGHKK